MKKWLFVVSLFSAILTFGEEKEYTEKLTFSHKRGFYTQNFDLTLSTTTPGRFVCRTMGCIASCGGVCFYRLKPDGNYLTKKLTLVK